MTIDTKNSAHQLMTERFELLDSKEKKLRQCVDSLENKIKYIQSICIELEERIYLSNVQSLENEETSKRLLDDTECLKERFRRRRKSIEKSMWFFIVVGNGFTLVLNKSAVFLVHIKTKTIAAAVFCNQRRRICAQQMSDNQKLFLKCFAVAVGAVALRVLVKCVTKSTG